MYEIFPVLVFILWLAVGALTVAVALLISGFGKDSDFADDPFATDNRENPESWRHCSQCSWYFYGKTKIQAWSPIRGAVIQGGLCPGCSAIRNFVPPREQ